MRSYAFLMGITLMACSTTAPTPAPAKVQEVASDGTCGLGMHQCPKCGVQGGYYCGRVCMDCPVLEADTQGQPPVVLALATNVCSTQTCN